MNNALTHSGEHLLGAHLQCVAARAADFSAAFESTTTTRRLAYLVGLWHEQGKYQPGFQRYVAQADNPDSPIEGKVGWRDKTHSVASFVWAMQRQGKSPGSSGACPALPQHATEIQ